jgi:hypothetical protein
MKDLQLTLTVLEGSVEKAQYNLSVKTISTKMVKKDVIRWLALAAKKAIVQEYSHLVPVYDKEDKGEWRGPE